MNICIATPDKETWDKAQLACFKHGWDWEREEYLEFSSDKWKEEKPFVLNDDGYDPDITHICVIDGQLLINYLGDGDPVEDDLELKTIEDLTRD